ncbi:hypothetical protein BBR47_54560 [Brevibacillus brevis NBRC 100599]|uniref:Uncharacterized protein n=1 Tax=Brevibacillus brevis (strain 47 / JCM 6285 / NBRC 100599) TaxID=358681 RepID=C0Z784_BREBN|nr:hypothetical protein BBR47_54560 [Brevibacillus brevis NBRC 100599]
MEHANVFFGNAIHFSLCLFLYGNCLDTLGGVAIVSFLFAKSTAWDGLQLGKWHGSLQQNLAH